MRRCDRGTKKRLRPMSEPKTERSSARLSWLLPRVWMEAEESMRKRGSWSAKLRVATRRAAMMPRAAATAAAKASLPQGERAQAGSRPRRTGTRRRARRKGSSASSSAAARGREKRASKPRAAGGRSISRWFVENRRASIQVGFRHAPSKVVRIAALTIAWRALWIGREMQWESRERTGTLRAERGRPTFTTEDTEGAEKSLLG